MNRLIRNASGAISSTARMKRAGGIRAINTVDRNPRAQATRLRYPSTEADTSSSGNQATCCDGRKGSYGEDGGKPHRGQARRVSRIIADVSTSWLICMPPVALHWTHSG